MIVSSMWLPKTSRPRRRSTIKIAVVSGLMGKSIYTRIFKLTEEIEGVIAADDPARLQVLLARRAEAFAALAGQAPDPSAETVLVIEQIQKCERRCREQAISRMAELKQDMDGIRKGKRLEKAYGQLAPTD
jgi:hypothetical protein